MVVGPFGVWEEAVTFHRLWCQQTRGKVRRIQRGVRLYMHFRKRYNLTMELQTKQKPEILAKQQRLRADIEARRQRSTSARKKTQLDATHNGDVLFNILDTSPTLEIVKQINRKKN